MAVAVEVDGRGAPAPATDTALEVTLDAAWAAETELDLAPIADAADALGVSAVCATDRQGRPRSSATVERLRSVAARTGDVPLVLQDLACPDAGAPDRQAEVIGEVLAHLRRARRCRVAVVWAHVDADATACAAAIDPDARQPLGPEAVERLCSDGLVGLGGRPKPAWDVVLAAA